MNEIAADYTFTKLFISTMGNLSYHDVILQEKEQLRLRRQKLGIEHSGSPDQENWFGIALSGGGIRSATINLGFLKTLNRFGILTKADYLSSVSGGGYTHAYIQATIQGGSNMDQLFSKEHVNELREHGEYMTPGNGIWKMTNTFLLVVAFVVSWFMSIINPLIVFGILYYAYSIVTSFFGANPFAGSLPVVSDFSIWLLYLSGAVFATHFVINIYLNYHLGISKFFNRIESALALLFLGLYAWMLLAGLGGTNHADGLWDAALKMVVLIVLGFYVNPNAISFHRYYRKQLSDLYLRFSGKVRNIPLRNLFDAHAADSKQYTAPYPIINTCLNLQNPGGDAKFKGTKASDYFLLSPLYCGSKLTGYVPTNHYDDYRSMTLPAAVTISAAAVNPGMGMYSNPLLRVLVTLLNARLGCWVSNPLVLKKAYSMVWWPTYFFRELAGRIGSDNRMINISDGGHIENLGVYELLRRGCRLIISVDAGEDQTYLFADLNNLILRARNEMGLEIRFRDGQYPEDMIRPRPSSVYSRQRFAVADILQWWEDRVVTDPSTRQERTETINLKRPRKVGTFVYVKSSVTAPAGKPDLDPGDPLKYGTYKYKIYHPAFPHESTGDQFFDPIQWEAYYQLGQYIAADVLGVDDLEASDKNETPKITVEALINWFDDPASHPLFKPESTKRGVIDSDILERARPGAEEVKYRM
ncbi:MAG: hypothetical protein IPM98_18090 [Lewinellaceae bacterium]|nr:hypothetical protein [Lewinellaceae bacterium]